MKNKRVTLIVLSMAMVFVLIAGVGIGVKIHMNNQLKHEKTEDKKLEEKQIKFLKEHEQELIQYIKYERPKVTSVKFDWNSVDIQPVGGAFNRNSLSVTGRVNTIKGVDDNEFSLMMDVNDNDELPNLETVEFTMTGQTLENYKD
ncbi:hypothetical protein Q2T76_01960 [Lactobacillus sp. YT155]|uniref:hypothetical protein n=1 Tax=Lactobacillus sp. YT155 TaxID=3060955 RepID=UPI00265EE5D2|nr:hypothetical protein [Lactobacillus sp. YT155]MDO1604814.1 hypothetical protein [Lactobacillus sp. YT155]